jgi:FemAB-related protein (PEP-CTERM system-associated)
MAVADIRVVEPDAGKRKADASTIVVRQMSGDDAPDWDRFVFAADGGTFFHRAGWCRIFREIFRLRPHYLLAERGGEIAGILPLVHLRSMLFGNALISAPFCVEGGTIAADAEVRRALDDAALKLFAKTGGSYVEFRSRKASRPDWQVKRDLYADFSKAISGDDNQNLLAIPRKQRAVVRKTLAGPLYGEVDRTSERLFRVYSESVRNLGTPMFPRRYFPALLEAFGSDCDIVMILEEGKPVSGVMNFYFRDSVMPYYGGGTAAARRNGANDLLYWEVMRRAAQRGYRRFDFGRSKANTGAFAFKKNWGFEPTWLEYEYWTKPGTGLPEKNPLNPKYAWFIAAWKRLPLDLANALGPLLIRNLG